MDNLGKHNAIFHAEVSLGHATKDQDSKILDIQQEFVLSRMA